MAKCVDGWNTNLWGNEFHMDFTSSYKFVCQMCFQCTILMREMYKLQMNKIYMISINKLWDLKFVVLVQIT
jgi:hypothetical protein